MNARRAQRPVHFRALAWRVWGNSLARGSDRVEAVLIVGLFVVWLLSVPLFATIASAEWPGIESNVMALRSSVTATDAVLLSDADLVMGDAHTSVVQPTATATWLGRDGRPTEGQIFVQAGARAGDKQTIWLNEQGAIVDRPMTTTTAAGLVVMVAVGGWLVLGALLWACRRVVAWRFDRRRRQLWEDAWASFDAGSRSS